jgi:hypothetical protein
LRYRLALILALVPTAAVAQPRRSQPAARPALIDYRVLPGDTCAAIALRLYRDVRRTNLIHENNPSLGRQPHRLRPGMTLRLPRAAPARGVAPDAILTQTENVVEIGAPTAHRARAQDPLFRGTTVSTGSSSAAEVTFADETQLRLSEQTTVVILGETNTRVRRLATARDTTLVRGTLRAFLENLSAPATPAVPAAPAAPGRPARVVTPRRPPARPLSIRTARGRVTLGGGEASLAAAEGGAVTLSVYRGQSQIQSGTRTVTVREGFAVRAEEGRALAPHRLPLAPTWAAQLPALYLAEGDRGRVLASWRPGAPANATDAPPAPAEWHVQVARDPSFLQVIVDTHLAPAATEMPVVTPTAGEYFVRVSAVDGERFEGPFAEAARVRVVVPRLVPTPTPYRSLVELGAGLRCGVDGAPLEPVLASVPIERRRAHTVRCTLAEGRDEDAVAREFPAESRAPFTVVARLVVPDDRAREGHVRVHVIDHAGVDLARDELTARGPDGVTVGALAAPTPAEPGVWLVPVRWTAAVRDFALTLQVAEGDPLRTERFTVPAVPAPPVVPDPFSRRVFVRGDVLGGYILSEYQRNDSAAAFGGSAPGLGGGVGASLRVGLDVLRARPGRSAPSFGANVMLSTWLYPATSGQLGVATMYGGGLHLALTDGRVVPWIDGNAGAVLTGDVVRFGVDFGVGLDLRLTRALLIGPTIRYVHVMQPEGDPFPEDARTLGAGLALTLRAE